MGKNRKKDVGIFIILIIITFIAIFYSIYLFAISFEDGDEITINYNEKENLSYKVWLKENNFYEEKYLTEEYNLISSAIKEIEIDFDYLLNTSKLVQGTSYYTINSKVVAYQKNDTDKRQIWNHQKLIKDKTITNIDTDTTIVEAKDNFKINYGIYQRLMQNYQKQYAISLDGSLIIGIEVNTQLKCNDFKNDIKLDKRIMKLEIPLTESIIRIKKTVDSPTSKILMEKADSKINYLKLTLSTFTFLAGVALSVFLSKLLVAILGIDSEYMKKVNKILRTYNPIIVNVDRINLEDKSIILVESFDELLDAQSELRVPILYCALTDKLSLFSIEYNKNTLVYRISSSLYDNNTKKRDNKDE